MKLYGIIGFPLEHSFSKKYFTHKFLTQGFTDCSYQTFAMPHIEGLKNIIYQNKNLQGLNVTIPHKKSVVALLNDSTNLPAGLLACNCIKILNNTLIGYNTDVIGFEKSLLPHLKNYPTSALILGHGGAADAVKFVLSKLNIAFKTVGRKLHGNTDFTYADLTEKIIKENLLIVNTTPLGTFPNINECADIPYTYLTPQHFLYDLVYNPPQTLFLQKAAAQGAATKNGYEMLVIQAEESWRIWNTAP